MLTKSLSAYDFYCCHQCFHFDAKVSLSICCCNSQTLYWILAQVDKKDPNATKTLSRLESVQKTCRESGALTNRYFIVHSSIFWILNIFVYWFLTIYKSQQEIIYNQEWAKFQFSSGELLIEIEIENYYRKGWMSFQKSHWLIHLWMQIMVMIIILAIIYAYVSASPRF